MTESSSPLSGTLTDGPLYVIVPIHNSLVAGDQFVAKTVLSVHQRFCSHYYEKHINY